MEFVRHNVKEQTQYTAHDYWYTVVGIQRWGKASRDFFEILHFVV